MTATTGEALAVIEAATPPRHRVFFHAVGAGRTGITVMLFGTNPVTLIVDTDSRPFPPMAWDIDPRAVTPQEARRGARF